MKQLKLIFFTFLFLTLFYSCTDDDDDYQTNTVENIQATGDGSESTGDGSKD